MIDGCPPGLPLSAADLQPDLDRRRPGTSRHVTQRREPDEVEIVSGIYEGVTTGTPIALLIRNTDQRSKDYGNLLDTFRPGHADYTYWRKYGLRDPRGGGRNVGATDGADGGGGRGREEVAAGGAPGTRVRGCMEQIGEFVIPFMSWDDVEGEPVLCAGRRLQSPS